MKVVSDASPLIALSAIGRLDLLHELFSKIMIPRAVEAEIHVQDQQGASGILQADWIETHSLESERLLSALSEDLDRGEAEAIALAVGVDADLLLIDERRGRHVARRLGCRILGLLGALVQAKRQGYLAELAPVLVELEEVAGFYVSEGLRQQILAAAGEVVFKA